MTTICSLTVVSTYGSAVRVPPLYRLWEVLRSHVKGDIIVRETHHPQRQPFADDPLVGFLFHFPSYSRGSRRTEVTAGETEVRISRRAVSPKGTTKETHQLK